MRAGTRLVEAAGAEGGNRQREPTVVLVQKLGSTKVVRGDGSGDTESSADLEGHDAFRELSNHEGQEGHVEKEEDEKQGEIGPQGRQTGRTRQIN